MQNYPSLVAIVQCRCGKKKAALFTEFVVWSQQEVGSCYIKVVTQNKIE